MNEATLKELCKGLKATKVLEKLTIGWNETLSPRAFSYLSAALQKSRSLTQLVLQKNNLTDESLLHISSLLSRNSSITYLGYLFLPFPFPLSAYRPPPPLSLLARKPSNETLNLQTLRKPHYLQGGRTPLQRAGKEPDPC